MRELEQQKMEKNLMHALRRQFFFIHNSNYTHYQQAIEYDEWDQRDEWEQGKKEKKVSNKFKNSYGSSKMFLIKPENLQESKNSFKILHLMGVRTLKFSKQSKARTTFCAIQRNKCEFTETTRYKNSVELIYIKQSTRKNYSNKIKGESLKHAYTSNIDNDEIKEAIHSCQKC
jgi:hypothetical protein